MAVIKDAELLAKETRGEPLLCKNGYISCFLTVHPLVNQKNAKYMSHRESKLSNKKKTFEERSGVELVSTHVCFIVTGNVWCHDGEDIIDLSKEILVCIVIQLTTAIAALH